MRHVAESADISESNQKQCQIAATATSQQYTAELSDICTTKTADRDTSPSQQKYQEYDGVIRHTAETEATLPGMRIVSLKIRLTALVHVSESANTSSQRSNV